MGKLADHLRKHLRGEALDTKPALDYFSTDGSIFKSRPKAVVYPRNTTDVRKVAKFSWQLAERGKAVPITTRGKGTDQGGGAIGEGLMLVMPAHMNELIDIDRDKVTVQPGMLYGDLQRTLQSHGRFLPPAPSSLEYSTIGGAVANNASGDRSLKYGTTADYIEELEVVLANGQSIRTHPLSKRELNKKKGQTDFEGELYRQIDGLLIDNAELIDSVRPHVNMNAAGYQLWDVRRPDGSFDLSRLIAGSQGTLGIVTETTLRTESYNPETHVVAAFFDSIEKAAEAVLVLRELTPSALELVDGHLLNMVNKYQPDQLRGIIDGDVPRAVLLVEFDDEKVGARKRKAKKTQKALAELASEVRSTDDYDEQEDIWKIRRSAAAIAWQNQEKKAAVPIIEDGIIPVEKTAEFFDKVQRLFAHHNIEAAIWGHAGDGNYRVQPLLNLQEAGDRQLAFKLMENYYRIIISMGGSTTAGHNDGRLRGPYLEALYGREMYQLFLEVKKVFDPMNTLNPGVKLAVDQDMLRKRMRQDYSIDHLYDHMPRAHT